MKSSKIKRMTLLSLFIAIEVVLTLTPLGFIAIGPIRSTTLHIPVILAGLILGWKDGFVVGACFGLLSVFINTTQPTPTSFVFSPFYSLGEYQGNLFSLIIAIVPRMLLGGIGPLMMYLLKWVKSINVRVLLSAGIASISHTLLVMSGIYIFFGPQYAAIKEVEHSQLLTLIQTVIMTNGIMEMIVGSIIVLALYKALKPIVSKGVL